jgi:hypothetical protein
MLELELMLCWTVKERKITNITCYKWLKSEY